MDSPLNTEQQVPPAQERTEKVQQKHQNEQQMKGNQASRRSRKDIEGRDFVCGCGKKYLSYPALYTHIKTKHEGRQPEGTMKYSTTAPAKKSKTKLEEQHLAQLSSLVKREDVKLLDLLGQKFCGQTALSSRLKSKILEKQITDAYHALLKTTTSPLKLTKENSLQQLLIAYLIGTGQFMVQKLHQQYQYFAKTVKECYYQMGGEVYNKCFSKKDGGLCYIPNFKVEKVKYFPLICDFYIRFFLPFEYSNLNINLMELILSDFCAWLNKRGFTFIQAVLNKEYKLAKPLEFEEQVKNETKKDNQEEEKGNRSELQEGDSQMKNNIKEENHSQAQNEEDLFNEENQENQENLKSQEINEKQESHQQNIQNPGNTQKIEADIIQSQISLSQNPNKNNLHKNWSLQVQPASQSSQQLPVQSQQPQNNEKFQSDVPKQQYVLDQINQEQPLSDNV